MNLYLFASMFSWGTSSKNYSNDRWLDLRLTANELQKNMCKKLANQMSGADSCFDVWCFHSITSGCFLNCGNEQIIDLTSSKEFLLKRWICLFRPNQPINIRSHLKPLYLYFITTFTNFQNVDWILNFVWTVWIPESKPVLRMIMCDHFRWC